MQQLCYARPQCDNTRGYAPVPVSPRSLESMTPDSTSAVTKTCPKDGVHLFFDQ